MARAFVIPVRTDCLGAGLQVLDLVPNTSQKNSIYDGPGQTFYLQGADCPWTTTVNGDAYVSGSRMTMLVAADDATVQDTTGGGNDCRATATATFGLASYLRERVQPGGVALATAGRMTPANAQLQAQAIMARAYSGLSLSLASINTLLSDAGLGGTADTDLDGAAALSESFGSVEDILRILSGEVYETPRYTIVTNIVGGPAYEFLGLTARNVLVAAQLPAITGKTFVSTGHFLTRTEHGFQDILPIVQTGEVLMSAAQGDLHTFAGPMTFKNPSFAYTAADLAFGKLPAARFDGVAIPTSGYTAHVCRVYSVLGTAL